MAYQLFSIGGTSLESPAFSVPLGQCYVITATGMGTGTARIEVLRVKDSPTKAKEPCGCLDINGNKLIITSASTLCDQPICDKVQIQKLCAPNWYRIVLSDPALLLTAEITLDLVPVEVAEQIKVSNCGCVDIIPPPPPPIVYCADVPVTGGGFGFSPFAPPDPLATVIIEPCVGDTGFDPFYLYPTGGSGHSVRVADCAGNTIGWAVNVTNCAVAEPEPQALTVAATHPINIVNNLDFNNTNQISNSVATFGTDANGDYILTTTDGQIFKAIPLTC
jgi:hypothetical protein